MYCSKTARDVRNGSGKRCNGVMSSLLSKLSAFLGDQYKLLKGVRKEVGFLKRGSVVSTMNALLVTLGSMDKLDPLAKDWRNKVRDLSYDIEDCIDLFMQRLARGDAKTRFMRNTVRQLKTGILCVSSRRYGHAMRLPAKSRISRLASKRRASGARGIS